MLEVSDYGHMMAKSLILFGPNSNPNPKDVDIEEIMVEHRQGPSSMYQNGC